MTIPLRYANKISETSDPEIIGFAAGSISIFFDQGKIIGSKNRKAISDGYVLEKLLLRCFVSVILIAQMGIIAAIIMTTIEEHCPRPGVLF